MNDPRSSGNGKKSLDGVLQAAFKPEVVRPQTPGREVLSAIRRFAVESQIHLRDTDDEAPLTTTSEEDRTDDRYQVMGEIARGGMGVVLKARDPGLGRNVAMKVLSDKHLHRTDLTRRFVEEAQIGGQLQHPGIVPIYEMGLRAGERPYFTMKLLQGQTLAALLEARRDPMEDQHRFLAIFEHACQTVAYAHARGVIHRDLKPSNIMVGSFGEVQVIDWGLAKVLAQGGVADEKKAHRTARAHSSGEPIRTTLAGSRSLAGSVMGTPGYMPPEQARGEIDELDERSDVFGLGAILCEILMGFPPFPGTSEESIRQKTSTGDLTRTFSRLESSDIDDGLFRIAKWALAPKKEFRPRNAGVLAKEVSAYLASVADRAREAELDAAEAEGRAMQERKARKLQLALAVTVTGAILLTGGSFWFYENADRNERLRAEARVSEVYDTAREQYGVARNSGPGEVTPWKDASNKVQQAVAIVGTAPVGAELRRRVDDLNVAIRKGMEAARSAAEERASLHELLQSLARIQITTIRKPVSMEPTFSEPDGNFETSDALDDNRYSNAFAEFGIPSNNLQVAEAIARFSVQEISLDVAAHFDGWASARRNRHDGETAGWQDLLRVAMGLDPDTWRNDLRRLVLSGSTDNGRLLELIGRDDARTLDPPSVKLVVKELVRRDLTDRAVEVLREACQVHTDSFDLWQLLGFLSLKSSTPDRTQALAATTAAVALNPGHSTARNNLGAALTRFGRYGEAIECYRTAIRLGSVRPVVYLNLHQALKETGAHEEGLLVLENALEVCDDKVAIYRQLGEEAIERRQFDEAIGFANAEIEELRPEGDRPELAWALVNLGEVLAEAGRNREASAAVDEALGIVARNVDDDVEFHGFRGRAMLGISLFDESIVSFLTALDLDPDNPVLWDRLGNAYHWNHEYDKAIEATARSAELDTRPTGYNNLGWRLRARGFLDRAVEAIERAIELDDANPTYHSNHGSFLFHRGDWDKAVSALNKASALGQRSWVILTFLGDAYTELGKYEDALAAYDEALRMRPSHREAINGKRDAQRLLQKEQHLIAIARGEQTSYDLEEIQLAARLALHRRLFVASAEQWERYFERAPNEVTRQAWYRDAALAAAQAAQGLGEGAGQLDAEERHRFRELALSWLNRQLSRWTQAIARDEGGVGLRHVGFLVSNSMLSGVRDEDDLAAFPEDEARRWNAFWEEVRSVLAGPY